MTESTTTHTSHAAAGENAGSEPIPPIQNYTDGYSYEVPRPFLTLQQAASVLGMTLRSIERSVLGRWGNKLPEGWLARRLKTSGGDEWRILPPPGFRIKLNGVGTEFDTTPPGTDSESAPEKSKSETATATVSPAAAPGDPLGYYMSRRKQQQQQWRPEKHTIDQPTIVIDRTEEVEHLLRELVAAKTALAEERRVHLDDMRMITQLQGSMRLLEVNAAEQARTKVELEAAKQELNDWKTKYNALVTAPWWRRLFRNQT